MSGIGKKVDIVGSAMVENLKDKVQGDDDNGESSSAGVDASYDANQTTGSMMNVEQMWCSATMAFYNCNATGMANESKILEANSEKGKEVSQALAAVSIAQSNAGTGNVNITTGSSCYASGTTAVITPEQYSLIQSQGGAIKLGAYSNSNVTTLVSSLNDMSSSLSSTNQELLLKAQMYSTNLQQAGSLSTSGLQSIGQTMKTTAGNV